jgi:hypothetical protein
MALPENMQQAIKDSSDDRRIFDYSWWMAEIYHWNLQAQIGNPQAFASGDQMLNMRNLAQNYAYNPNLLSDYYRVATSRLVVMAPTATVQPTTPGTDDVAKAIASQEAINYFWWSADLQGVWETSVKSLLVQGNAGLHIYWDQSKGNKGEDGRPLGKVCLDAFEPRDLFYEAGSRNAEESAWVARRKRVSRTTLHKQFPDKVEQIDEAASGDTTDKGWMGSFFSMFGGKKSKEMADRLDVFYVYDRESNEYGIFLSPDIWLWKGETPDGLVGIHHLVYTPMLGSPFGKGLIQDLVGPMAAYNMRRKQGLDYINLVNQPKVLVPENGNVTSFNDRPGQVINFKPGFKPEYMQLQSWPAGAERDLDRIRGEMNDIAGMQNTSLGKQETGSMSGVAIRSLAAQDINKLTATISHTERVFARVFTDALILYKHRLTEKQSVRMFDTYGAVVYAELDATNLYDAPEVRIDSGSMFVLTRKDLEAQTMTMLEGGLISIEEAKERMSISSGRKEALRHMQALNEARGVLDVVKNAPMGLDPLTGLPFVVDVRIYKTDPLDAYREVFGEAMQDIATFNRLPEERQKMIEDIFLSVSNPSGTPDQKSMMSLIVYPPMAMPGEELSTVLSSVQSENTQASAVNNAQEVQQRRGIADAADAAQLPFGATGTEPLGITSPQVEASAPVPGME